MHLTLNLRAGGAEGLEASSVRSWVSSSRNLLKSKKLGDYEIENKLEYLMVF